MLVEDKNELDKIMSNIEKDKSSKVKDQFVYHCNECQQKNFTINELSSHIIIEGQ